MITLCATPIGNLGDITLRALDALKNADLIACEDTRRTLGLLTHYGVKKPVTAYHAHNWKTKTPELIRRALGGEEIVLVSDAGMPGISDPGAELLHAAVQEGVPVTLLPGASASLTAAVLSGLDCSRLAFEGFLPREKKPRRARLEELVHETRTMVIFESPHRVRATLAELLGILGDRPAALARELTKLHEEVLRSSLARLVETLGQDPPGELVLVVGGYVGVEKPASEGDIRLAMARKIAEGLSRREAARQVAREMKTPASDAYRLSLDDSEP